LNPREPTNLSTLYKSEGIPPCVLYAAYSVSYHLLILSIKGDSSDRVPQREVVVRIIFYHSQHWNALLSWK